MTTGLDLSSSDIMTSGIQRWVYLHPTDPAKLIKVLKSDSDMVNRRSFSGTMDRLFPSTRLRHVRKEYGEYLRMMLRHPTPDFHPPIAHMYGFVSTSAGLGCISERVLAPDGTLGDTLRQKINTETLTAADIGLLNDTIARLFACDIRASDTTARNFVFGQRYCGSDLGPRECVLVDGFGDIHAIPVRSMGKWANQFGLNDSFKRLARSTKLSWDPKTRQFSHS